MASVINITGITHDTWLNVNTATSIPAGTEMSIQNTGVVIVRLQESTTSPSSLTEGKILTNVNKYSNEAVITSGSEDIWVLSSVEDSFGSIAVQAV